MLETIKNSDYSHVMCIYKIENKATGKVYIGSTNDLSDRIRSHVKNLTNNTHLNKWFQNSWNVTTNKDNFKLEIVELINDESFLPYAELYYIEKYRRVKGVYNSSDPLEEIKLLKSRNKQNKKKTIMENIESSNRYVEFKNVMEKEFTHLFDSMREKLKEKHKYISFKKVSDYIYESVGDKFERAYFDKSLKTYIRNNVNGSIYNFEAASYLDETVKEYNIPKRELTILHRDLGNEIGAFNASLKNELIK